MLYNPSLSFAASRCHSIRSPNHQWNIPPAPQGLLVASKLGYSTQFLPDTAYASYSWNIALLYIQQGELAKAEKYLSRAVELMEQLEHRDLEAARKALAAVRAKLRVAAPMETKYERNTF